MLNTIPTWKACFEAGMTAREAERRRGSHGAYEWAERNGVKFKSDEKPGHKVRQPCLIRGVLYPSQRAAAEALGVSESTVSLALVRGTQDDIGCGKGKGKRC